MHRLIELTSPKEPGGQELPGEVRMAAASALAKLGQPKGSYIAREYFQGGKETLRAQAATAELPRLDRQGRGLPV